MEEKKNSTVKEEQHRKRRVAIEMAWKNRGAQQQGILSLSRKIMRLGLSGVF